jgi:hypothetical protein
MATQRARRDGEGGVPDGLILGVIGFLLGITLLVWTGTGIAGLLSHGAWPAKLHFTHTPVAMRHLLTQPHDITGAWQQSPADALPSWGLFWGIFIGQLMVLFVLGAFVIGALARYRVVLATRRQKPVLTPAQAPAPVVVPQPREEAEPAAQPEAESVAQVPVERAGVEQVPVAQAPRHQAAAAHFTEAELTTTYVLFAAPRSDKGKRIVQPAILNAAGAVLVTTADPDTFHQTVGNRTKLGPVHVFDPAHLVDTPGRLRWAPHSGCEDPDSAASRAAALLFPLRPHATADTAMYDAARTLLRCWLHAAAVDGQPFRQVHRWAGGSGAQDAVRILRSHPKAKAGWSGELESILHAHTDRRDAAQALIHRALEGLSSIHIRDACNPGRNPALDLESFVRERGTLYLVGEPTEDPRIHPGAMPLLTALASSVVEHGRRMAARSPAGRLDPPLTLVLDDIAALAPIPGLPDALATGTALGLPALAVLRSPEQSRAHWPDAAPWNHADARLVLGPAAPALLDELPDAIRLA